MYASPKATPSTSSTPEGYKEMGTKKFKPTTPSRRFMSGSDFAEVTTDAPEKQVALDAAAIATEVT